MSEMFGSGLLGQELLGGGPDVATGASEELQGTAFGVTSISGSLGLGMPFSATAAGSSTVVGYVPVGPLTGAPAGSVTVTADATKSILRGTPIGTATVSVLYGQPQMPISNLRSGTFPRGVGSVTGRVGSGQGPRLGRTWHLSGTSDGSSSVTADVLKLKLLSGTATGSASLTASLTMLSSVINTAATIYGIGSASGSLIRASVMQGAPSGSGSVDSTRVRLSRCHL